MTYMSVERLDSTIPCSRTMWSTYCYQPTYLLNDYLEFTDWMHLLFKAGYKLLLSLLSPCNLVFKIYFFIRNTTSIIKCVSSIVLLFLIFTQYSVTGILTRKIYLYCVWFPHFNHPALYLLKLDHDCFLRNHFNVLRITFGPADISAFRLYYCRIV